MRDNAVLEDLECFRVITYYGYINVRYCNVTGFRNRN